MAMGSKSLALNSPPAIDQAELVVSQADESEWDQFVNGHPDATGYHLWGWRKIFEDAFGHDTEYLAAREGDRVVGVLPLVIFRSAFFGRFAVSLPFVNYGGVVASDQVVAYGLIEEASKLAAARRLSHLELRHRVRRFADRPAKQHKVAMLLSLAPDPHNAWERLDRKVRNQIRKAEKSGLCVAMGGRERLGEFYSVFAENMRDLGTPVYSRRFFEAVLEQFPRQTRVFVVMLGTKPVAAGISYTYRDTLEVPWASSLKAYRTVCPNNLLYWSVIRQAIADGFRRLDFGRSTPDEGPYHFKRQWGATPEPLCWEYKLLTRRSLPNHSPSSPKFKAATAIWKRLPVRVATFMGPSIVRSIP